MRPEATTVVMRPDLAAQVNEYAAQKAAGRFVAPAAAPIFRSPDQNGTYPIMRRANFKKRTDNARNEGGRYNRIVGEFGQGTFACDEHGLENPVDERRRRRYAKYFDAEKSAAQMTWFQNMLNWEYRVSTLYSGGGFTNTNVATAWSTVATAVPLTDLQTGINALQDKCGVSSFEISLIIPRADFQEMNLTDQIIDKVKYTFPGVQPSSLTARQIANMLELKQVLVAQSVQDSKEEGITETNAQIWTAGVMYLSVLCDPDDDLEDPSGARTVLWTGDSPEIPVVESYREDAIRSDVIRVRDDTDEVLIGETDLFVYKLTNT